MLSILRRTASLSYPLSPFRITAGGIWSSRAAAAVQSATWPPVSRKARGRQKRSLSAWTFVVRPPRERPIAWVSSPLMEWPAPLLHPGRGQPERSRST